MSTGDDTITEPELEGALRELAVRTGNADSFYPELARNIVKHVKAHREHEYEPGGIYLSPAGACWRRTDDGGWEEFGTKVRYSHGFPVRPLRKLVARPSNSDLAAAVKDRSDGLLSDEQLFDCLVRLLDGAS